MGGVDRNVERGDGIGMGCGRQEVCIKQDL